MEAAYRNLGRACEIQVFAFDRVDVRIVRREPAGADEMPPRGRERAAAPARTPLRRDGRGRVGTWRERAGPRRRSSSRSGSPEMRAARSMSKRPISVCSFASPMVGGSPTRRISRASSSVAPSGNRVVRRVGNEERQTVALGLRLGQLAFKPPEILLRRLHLLELFGSRLALEVRPRPQLVDLGDEGAPALIGAQQRIERVGCVFACERSAPAIGVRARGLEVDHRGKSKRGRERALRRRRRTLRRRRSAAP